MIEPKILDTTIVVMISKTKFQPITPKIKKAPMFGYISPIPASKKGRKIIKLVNEKIPVLMIGTRMLIKIRAKYLFFFFNRLKTKPAINPAIPVFNKQTNTVPRGLSGINMANVSGDKRVIKPLKKPRTAPENGPNIAAAITIVTSEIFKLIGPMCK